MGLRAMVVATMLAGMLLRGAVALAQETKKSAADTPKVALKSALNPGQSGDGEIVKVQIPNAPRIVLHE